MTFSMNVEREMLLLILLILAKMNFNCESYNLRNYKLNVEIIFGSQMKLKEYNKLRKLNKSEHNPCCLFFNDCGTVTPQLRRNLTAVEHMGTVVITQQI